MKTTIFLFLFFFSGIAVTQTFAQDKANNASQWWSDPAYAQAGVWCDGEMIDFLTGEIRIHYVFRTFKNGELVMREIDHFSGELISTTTGEVFKFNRILKWELADVWTGVSIYNMKGNMGTKYSGKIYVDYSTGTPVFTELHAICH